MNYLFPYPKMGYSFSEILEDPLTKKLLGHDAVHAEKMPFVSGVTSRLKFLLNDPTKHLSFLKIGYTALEAFLQANATGPPLDFDPTPIIFPEQYRDEISQLKQELFQDLSVDGDAVYALTPHIELFWLAHVIMSNHALADAGFNGRRARLRINFWHQKLLQEKSDALQDRLYTDAKILGDLLSKRLESKAAAAEEHYVEFLLERAAVRIFYGDDTKARDDLALAAQIRNFEFALTGAMGKRTKYQNRDISQLVVLAKSRDFEPEPYSSRKSSRADISSRKSSTAEARSPQLNSRPTTPASSVAALSIERHSPQSPRKTSLNDTAVTQPENLPLNDDTLLENIEFAREDNTDGSRVQIEDEDDISHVLAELDPGSQPLLFPVDSIILLSIASSISNTSPGDGLTREETLPFATRVLDGGSSNWQVYTQALLVRSRIEGYKSRTTERGLLQLQALVDQVIAETTGKQITTSKGDEADDAASGPTTFLPKVNVSESASVAERLKYIYQLSPPLRWELEAELAQRWTQMGGLRTALEIYERLRMQAEVALCLAATDREAEATKLLKSLLFEDPNVDIDSIPQLRKPRPSDAPRLLCILGDVHQEPKYYVLAWTVSNQRYARAQRSLGRYYTKIRNPPAAAEAYQLALRITRLDESTWFALGCVQLQLEDWPAAVESFTRVVQLEDRDAEGWSNLAAALLKLPPPKAAPSDPLAHQVGQLGSIDEELTAEELSGPDPLQHKFEALRALRRATNLKREDARIWDNFLTVAASIPPRRGTPWNEVIQAMSRIIDLRSKKQGEEAIDLKVLEAIVTHVTSTFDYPVDKDEDQGEDQGKDQGEETVAPDTNLNDINDDDTTQPNNDNDETPPFPTHPHPNQAPHTTTKSKRTPFIVTSLLRLIDTQILPLATSPQLFTLLSRLSLWRQRPAESLSFLEKAWRATTTQPNVYGTEHGFYDVVDATVRLCAAYRTLGEQERERTGGPVEKNWRFKSRSAIRSVMGRGRDSWDGSSAWKSLEGILQEVSVSSSANE